MTRHLAKWFTLTCLLMAFSYAALAAGSPERRKPEAGEKPEKGEADPARRVAPGARPREDVGEDARGAVDPLGTGARPDVTLQPPVAVPGTPRLDPLTGDRTLLRPDADPTVRFYQDVTGSLEWNRRAGKQGMGAEARAKKVFGDMTMARERAVEALPEGPQRAEAERANAGPISRKFDGMVERGKARGLKGDALYEWVIRESAVQPLYSTAAQGPRAIKPWEMPGEVTPNPSLVKLEDAAQAGNFKPRENVTYLWVLGPKGELRVGIETQTPRPTDPAKVGKSAPYGQETVPPQKQAYGHPTLVYDLPRHQALYAGELFYKGGKWTINADSGRFGRDRRTPEQGRELLAQAQMLFKNYAGMDVRVGERFAEGAVTPNTPASELGNLLDQAQH